jgi:hypothetical protein
MSAAEVIPAASEEVNDNEDAVQEGMDENSFFLFLFLFFFPAGH